MKALDNYLLQFGRLTAEELKLIMEKTTEITLEKDAFFSKAAYIPRRVGFVLEGVIRGCYYNNKGEEITRCFITAESLAVDYPNFEAETASSEYLQACTATKMLVFSKADWDALSDVVPSWDQIKNKMVQKCMYQKSRKSPSFHRMQPAVIKNF